MCPGPPTGEVDFPSFWEGLSLRPHEHTDEAGRGGRISLPFWKGFHRGAGSDEIQDAKHGDFPAFS